MINRLRQGHLVSLFSASSAFSGFDFQHRSAGAHRESKGEYIRLFSAFPPRLRVSAVENYVHAPIAPPRLRVSAVKNYFHAPIASCTLFLRRAVVYNVVDFSSAGSTGLQWL